MQLKVSPERALIDEPVLIRLEDLAPGGRATVRAQMQGYASVSWTADASFVADAEGVVDLSRNAPVSGSYEGVDGMGLFWSMREAGTDVLPVGPAGRFTVQISAEIDGAVVASVAAERLHLRDVVAADVREGGLVGRYFRPIGPGRHPAVLVMGGSGGGLHGSQLMAAVLASHGFATLALAYFGMEWLPPRMTGIPLEYFDRAFDWLAAQPGVDGDRIGVVGTSRGGELVLLLGATFPRVGAVVGYVPSHVVWCGDGREAVPSWTLRGEPLPTIQRARVRATPPPLDEPISTSPSFLLALQDRGAEARAAIPVERIDGPVLLISGREDAMWPSTLMADRAAERLAAHGHRYPVEHLAYPGAGHAVYLPHLPTTATAQIHPVSKRLYDLGGNPRDLAYACADSWPRVIRFLRESLGSGR